MTRAVQGGLLVIGVLVVYLLFFVTRDILLRTTSLWVQLLCIALTFFLPIIGFFLYLLIRPARTVREREMESMLQQLLKKHPSSSKKKG
ncbi:hypothetical protein COU77_02030 [Candidatus Peregrinibacteria bacterium CG10_big_fil_rev_8_21_14_0_10_49_16]|nr:MAG: hypothetical protein COU77_02030 [Candidatus Peregrinibacteria bacterium CG10_big_fil_rev_8_21_14_0_10_49_16]